MLTVALIVVLILLATRVWRRATEGRPGALRLMLAFLLGANIWTMSNSPMMSEHWSFALVSFITAAIALTMSYRRPA
jgi:uncharacterized membrane protein YgaE (UPF0421/DUF939 family)